VRDARADDGEQVMTHQSSYPELGHFFGAYLNQDYELSGETIEEMVSSLAN